MASSGAASYADCVSSLRNSLKFLDSSVSTLDDGVADFPRLVKVLKSVRVRFFPQVFLDSPFLFFLNTYPFI